MGSVVPSAKGFSVMSISTRSFLTPHAILFRRREVDVETLIADYERGLVEHHRD